MSLFQAKMNTRRFPRLVLFIASSVFIPISGSTALAEDPPMGKGPEVSTVGTGPYLGPLPEELAKLEQTETLPETVPPQSKDTPATTITPGIGNTLTVEELAKLAELLAIPVTLPSTVMEKLEPMQVPVNGIPSLTAEEREKRAQELAAPRPIAPAPAPAPATSTDVMQAPAATTSPDLVTAPDLAPTTVPESVIASQRTPKSAR